MKSPCLYTLMITGREEKMQHKIRLQVVRYAKEHGIKATARHFACSKNTVRLWLRRYISQGSASLINRSRAPKTIPHKTSQEEENHVVVCRNKTPCYGPKRLKYFYEINASERAIARILKERKLTRRKRKKYHRKRDLRDVKAKYKSFTHHQEDVKHLYDIPNYWPQMKMKGLPKYQYTIRDTKSGAMMLGYGGEYSEIYSSLFTEEYLNSLCHNNVNAKDVVIQTDNGAEFGGQKRDLSKPGFVNMIRNKYGAEHVFIPPGMSNANADVESVHATIEQEFFDLEQFESRQDFFIKVQAYQYFYNLVRPNFSKKGKTPSQIVREDIPNINENMLLFPVIDIDALFRKKFKPTKKNKGGQHVPASPGLYIAAFLHLYLV